MAVTTVRPTSTDRASGVSTSGALAAHVVTSDTNNATVVQGAVDKGLVLLGIPSVTVSSTVRVRQARVRVTAANDGTDPGHTEQIWYRFHDPSPWNVNGQIAIANRAATSYVDFNGPWNLTPPLGGSWTQAVVDRMEAYLFWYASTNGSFLKVSEVYVDWQTDTQPTVTAVTVTGATVTTRPTFAWTYADTEGDLQVEWRAKAFSAAQYGATGFDPETSTSVWDSGAVAGDAGDSTVAADLINGGTYKVYVKAAQGWPVAQGLGSVWYSTWAASSAFTITLSPPPTPSITVTQELGLPRYANRVVVSLAGINALSADSASFETSVGDWVADSNCTITTSATNPKSGAAAMQMTATGAGTMVARSGTAGSTARRVKPGSTYSTTASFRTAVTGRTVNAGIRWYDVSNAAIGADVYGTNQTDTTAGYTAATATATAPANAYAAVELAKVTAAAAAEVHRVDEAGQMPGSGTTWTPGGYGQNGSVVVEATQRISDTIVRGRTPGAMHPQIYSSGALTQNADGFYARQANDTSVFRQLDRVPPESPADTTTGMIEWQIRVGSFSYLDIGAPDGVATDGQHPYLMPAVPGRDFTLTAWMWASASITVRLGLVFVDNVNTQVGSTALTSNTVLTTTPQRLTVTATAPAGAVWARGQVEDTLAATGISVFLTQTRYRLAAEADEAWPGQVFAFTRYTVRNGTVPLPTNGDDTVTVVDHEAPPGRFVLYTATSTALTTSAQVIASARSTPVHVFMDLPAWTLLKAPFVPGGENALLVYRAPGDTSEPVEDATELHLAGRDLDPVVTRDWAGRRGAITLHLFSDLDEYRLAQLVPSSRTLLIQWSNGGQTYCRVTASPVVHVRGTYRVATITYLQQARPS